MKNKIGIFVLMHFGFFIYSLYAVLGKIASKEHILSSRFVMLYGIVVFIMAIYAFLWQKVLKFFPLSVASANKSVTIIWGIVFGILFFGEKMKLTMVIGAVIILAGIFILNIGSNGVEK